MLKLMPTKLDRIQVLFNKDLFNKLRLLARIERRSLSSMVGSIVEDAIKSNKYKSLLSKAKANDLKSEIKESKSVIKEILQSEISNELDFDANSKLKKLDAILSLISESKKEFSEEPLEEDLSVKDLLVEDALKPQALIEEIQSNTDYKINKMNEMLQKIQQK